MLRATRPQFVKSINTTLYGIHSLRFTGTNLWNSLPINVKKIKPFSSFRQNVKNSMIDDLLPEVLRLCYL